MNRRAFTQLVTGAVLAPSLPRAAAAVSQPQPPSRNPPPFRFSVMLWTIDRNLPVERCLEIVAQAGYHGVEFVNEFATWSGADYARISAKLLSLGLVCDSIACLDMRLGDPQAAPAILAALSRRIEVAKRLHCPQIIVTSGSRIHGLSPDAHHAACIENLKRAADLASHNNIEIVVEPIDVLEQPLIWINSVAQAFAIVRAVNHPQVKVLYDFYHEQRAAGNLIRKLDGNMEWIGLVHIADVPGRHEPGTGEIDYRNIYRRLAELNYTRFITMEYFPTRDTGQSLRMARLVAEQSLGASAAPYSIADVG